MGNFFAQHGADWYLVPWVLKPHWDADEDKKRFDQYHVGPNIESVRVTVWAGDTPPGF